MRQSTARSILKGREARFFTLSPSGSEQAATSDEQRPTANRCRVQGRQAEQALLSGVPVSQLRKPTATSDSGSGGKNLARSVQRTSQPVSHLSCLVSPVALPSASSRRAAAAVGRRLVVLSMTLADASLAAI